MIIDIICKINNYKKNYLDIMKIDPNFDSYMLYIYMKYLIYTNKKFINTLYHIYEKYNILEYFYKYFKEINKTIENHISLFQKINKQYPNISKIINFLLENDDSIIVMLNISKDINNFIFIYSNKKKWNEKMKKLDKNTDIVEIFKIINETFIYINIIKNYNVYVNDILDQENVIYVNTYH